jgi:hypothetical protein
VTPVHGTSHHEVQHEDNALKPPAQGVEENAVHPSRVVHADRDWPVSPLSGLFGTQTVYDVAS